MTQRPISRILELLAEETQELAGVAKRLDRVIPTVIEQLPAKQGLNMQDLQQVDALYQHLEDTARALRKMARLVDASTELCATSLADDVRLDYFKTLLRDDPVASDPNNGHAQLF